ncbi:MAG: Uma2 family endonuclease [bacterium]
MTATPVSKIYTWEDALALPDGERYEVIDGELRERIMSSMSSYIASVVMRFLWRWLDDGRQGFVTGSDGGFTIFPWAPGDVRMPDVAYLSRSRLKEMPERGWISVPPELAVEVVSPTDQISAAEDKAQDYIRAGVDLVWVVIPSTKSVHVWRKNGERAVVRDGGTLSGEEVLPGLSIEVASLFPESDES